MFPVISKIKTILVKNRKLLENFSYLSIIQVLNIFIPLISYPYLLITLGKDVYGLVVFAQAIVSYMGIIVDFGFKISATKNISIHRDNPKKIAEIVSNVLFIKLCLWMFSLGLLLLIVFIAPSLRENILLYIFSFSLLFNELIFPQWYFQGVERMKYITLITLISRILFLVSIFIFIREQNDYILVPLLNGGGIFLGACVGLYIMFKKEGILFVIPSYKNAKVYFKESMPLFLSNAVLALKDKFSVIFIGASLGMADVAIYDLSIKVMNLFMQPIDIVNATIYPKVAKEKNIPLMLKTAKFTFFGMLIIIGCFYPFIDFFISLLGASLDSAELYIKILLISPLLMVWSLAFARNGLIILNEYKIFNIGIFLTSAFYGFLIGLAFLFQLDKYLLSFVIITVLVYAFELLYRWLALRKLKIIS